MANSTRQRLVEKAYDLFARNGFHAIGLDRVFDEVGVSKQTFYNHFECKDDLVLAVLDYKSRDELALINRLLDESAGSDPRARLYAIFDVLDSWLNDPEFRGCVFITAAAEFSAHNEPPHQAAAKHAMAIHEMLRDLAERAGANDPTELASQLLILLDGALVFRHVTGNNRAAKIARETGTVMIDRHLPPVAQSSNVRDN
jgi:AcrR family transcriptional regulator